MLVKHFQKKLIKCVFNNLNLLKIYIDYIFFLNFSIPPEDWRTSTRYNEVEDSPEFITSTPQRIPRQDFPRYGPRVPTRARRRLDLTTGVAIVPRRIDCKYNSCDHYNNVLCYL